MRLFSKLIIRRNTRAEICHEMSLHAALAFNRGHAYRKLYPRWKCPRCNKVHESNEFSVWTGPQYSSRCGLLADNRCAPELCPRRDNLIDSTGVVQ